MTETQHRTYDEYGFSTEPDPQLRELVQEYEHIFNDSYPMVDVMGAWTLDKPAGLVEIFLTEEKTLEMFGPQSEGEPISNPTPEEIGEFLHEFERWFYYDFDGYNLFFSRFPELSSVLASADTALRGMLFGYDTKDVAQYLIEMNGGFKDEVGWS